MFIEHLAGEHNEKPLLCPRCGADLRKPHNEQNPDPLDDLSAAFIRVGRADDYTLEFVIPDTE
jgi:hypothetical protein